MEFHVWLLLFMVICGYAGISTAGQVLPPRITPFQEDFVTIPKTAHKLTNSSQTFRLLCEGQKPVTWKFPAPFVHNFQPSMKNLSSWEQASHIDYDYPYASHLLVEDASYDDTGYYYCSYNSSQMEPDTTSSIYIFVQDKLHLLVGDNGYNTYHAMQYMSVVIDCRPTSPDVEVSLWRDDMRIDTGTKPTESQGMKVSFDPTIGFTLENVNINNDDPQYECRGERGDDTDEFYVSLSVLAHTDSMAKPRIIGESIVAVGGELILNCTVMVDSSIFFSMNFTVPNPKSIEEGRIQLNGSTLGYADDPNGVRKKVGILVLKILRASRKDLGNYTCNVEDHAHNGNTATRFINVINDDQKFINLTTEKHTLTTTAGTSTLQWVVDVLAYPSVANLTWFSPDNRTIPLRSSKYSVNSTTTQTIFKIHDINIWDTGTYRLLAMNDAKEETLKLKLIVKDKPAVTLTPDPEMYYFFEKSYEFNCEVIGYPKPDIQWGFEVCDNPPNCNNTVMPVSRTKISKEWEKNGSHISTLVWKASRSGYLTCRAKNSEGFGEETRDLWVTDVLNGFHMDGKMQAVTAIEDDNITMNCGASKYNNSKVQWFLNSTDRLISDYKLPNVVLSMKTTQFSYQSILTITNITNVNNGFYYCSSVASPPETGSIDHVQIKVQAKQKPNIISKEMDGSTVSLKTDNKVEWTCLPMGVPLPNVRWFKDNELLDPKNHSIFELSPNSRTLVIKYQSEKTAGTYTCEAWNRAGVIRKYKTVKFAGGGLSVGITATLVGFVLIVVTLITILVIKMRREQVLRNELKIAGLAHFEEGAMDCINPDLPIDDQAELLPYDRKWEFPRESLKLGKQLGAGAFGIVMKAEALGINEGEPTTTVAVKMVKRNAEYTYIKALASELKIMVHLGKHLNVVNLLGACTKNLTKRELLVIVEYCRFGNLHNYLLRHRADFIDQVDPKTGQIDPSLGADIISRHESINSKSRLKYAALSFSSNSGEMSVDYRAPVSNSSSGENPEMASICMTPGGDEGCMLSNNSIQPEWRSNYRGDYKGNVRPICTRDLLCWAFQVARGMEYLAGRKVLHGDLAARNILLADNNVVKICDFGLAKSMYKTDNYRKKGDGPLPVKWMAIESIRDRVFSTQSDVWSFGIVLWEFFSLARTPYPGMEADEKLYTKLIEGYRMDKPEYATKEVYDTIEQCWLTQPNDRPTFSDLSEQLGNMLEETVRMHYIDLNGPYMDMNTIWKAGNHSDYLAMMSAPTYGNLVAPGEDDDEPHQYVNSPNAVPGPLSSGEEASGYMCMKSPDPVIFSPRPNSPSMFNFAPESRKVRNDSRGALGTDELRPMLAGGRSGSDSDTEYKTPNIPQIVNNLNKDTKTTNTFSKDSDDKTKQNIAPSFSNPSYQTMGPIISATPDNYVNMPQQKLESGLKTDRKNTDLPVSFSNPNYVSMGKVEGVNESSNKIQAPGTGGENYVNLPSHGHNLSNASSGFQSDLGESPYVN